jgi:glycerophosphoryl diester phosphodiesterase
MRELIAMGVDGIITDYPDRLRQVILELGLPVPESTPVEY